MPRTPLLSRAVRKRKAWKYDKADGCENTFSFRSEGHEGVSMYDAHSGAVQRLEGRDDPMFFGYGTKVTYIVALNCKEYREQKNAHDKRGPITRVKAVKQIAQVLWNALQEQHGERHSSSPDLLKPYYLFRLERVNKSALLCTLGTHPDIEDASLVHTATTAVTLSPQTPSSTPAVASTPPASPARRPNIDIDVSPPQPAIKTPDASPNSRFADDTLLRVREHIEDCMQSPRRAAANKPSQNNNVLICSGTTGPNTPSLPIPYPAYINDPVRSSHEPPASNAPLDATELVHLHSLLKRFIHWQEISNGLHSCPGFRHATRVSRLCMPCPPSEATDRPLTGQVHPHLHHQTQTNGEITQTEETEEDHPPVNTSALYLRPMSEKDSLSICGGDANLDDDDGEPGQAGVTADKKDDGNKSDLGDAFSHRADSFPSTLCVEPRFGSNPYRWELLRPCGPPGTLNLEDSRPMPVIWDFGHRLLSFLCTYLPQERDSLCASEVLNIELYKHLSLYYQSLADGDQRVAVSTGSPLDCAVVAVAPDKLAYIWVYDFLRVTLPSGRTEDVVRGRWMKSSTCKSTTPLDGRQVFEQVETSVFVFVKSIVRVVQGVIPQLCYDCDYSHFFLPNLS